MLAQLTPLQQRALSGATASARLAPFRRVYSGHETPAIGLYHLDAKLASHVHAHLRIVELVLRQHMHAALTTAYGRRWFDDNTGARLSREAKDKIRDAYGTLTPRNRRNRTAPPPGADKIVAALMLGFWVSLLRTPNDADHTRTLWTPALAA
ncbi:hypothetical protein R3Q06_34090 [Rhodococcus erythropolis]|uniref:hypothetical protein n=1 Tax=Rhodococcus erythropolis TaxID=1833 RepID=UPI0029499035|nr:hypothetical protein [Rhodococcus erythropolis]MDV6278448.1 hypothetical protein [Rhodococcus erythropolis]